MKIALLNIIFLISFQMFCQEKDSIRYISFPAKKVEFINLNRLTEIDTVFIYFNYKKNQRRGFSRKKEKIVSYTYILDFEDNILGFSTGMEEYLSVDDMQKNKKAGVKWVDKKFLRKNKEKIYSYKRIKKNGFYITVEEISRATIYLIDIKIKENGKYKAREVGALFPIDI
jgi:hypothetical protein